MSKPITISNTFATQPGPIPLSQLDTDFSQLSGAINDLSTYSNYYADSSVSANSISVVLPNNLLFSYVTGQTLTVRLANTNTSTAVTINVTVNSVPLAGIPVLMSDASLPPIGSLVVGAVVTLVFGATYAEIISAQGLASPILQSGTFTLTSADISGFPTISANFSKAGNIVTITATNSVSGTSTATTFYLTGIPSFLQPIRNQSNLSFLTGCLDNGAGCAASIIVFGSVISFAKVTNLTSVSGLWTASGTKTSQAFTITYGLT